MPTCTDVHSWRKATSEEVRDFWTRDRPKPKSKPKSHPPSKRGIVVRTHLRPVDVYAYLRARFGKPNGFQNVLRRDDSDNLIHWDFNLKAGLADVYIAGALRNVQILTSEDLADQDWQQLILRIKHDFARVAEQKSSMTKSFEKYLVFQNKFVAIADLCAEMHAAILDAPSSSAELPATTTKRSMRRLQSSLDALSKRANGLYGHCLTLRLLTPVMAEAFINMIIVTLCKSHIRNDRLAYEQFIRAKLTTRLEQLSQNCDGFVDAVNKSTDSYAAFMRVMNARNFAIHGNVDPVREQIETVYFEGRRPLFAANGDNILKLFEHLEQINRPADVIRDYEAVHSFLHEITTYLSQKHQTFFEQVITDPYPGYEVNKKRVTRILPNHSAGGYMEGLRYDDELQGDWQLKD